MALINALANSMPVANQKLQNQRKAAADLQLQQAVAAAPAAAPVQPSAAALGGASAQAIGTKQVAAAQQNVQQQANLGATAIADKAAQIQNNLTSVKQGIQQQQLGAEERFGNLSMQAKQQMFDSRKQFAMDENGRKFLNERQLLDYARASGIKDEQFRNYAASAEQAHRRNLQTLDVADQKIKAALKQAFATNEQGKNQELIRELSQRKADMEKRIADAKANAANNRGMWVAAGTVAGAVVGSIVPGAGTAAGAAIGGALGGMAASATEEEV